MNVHRHLLMGYTMISSLLLAIPRSSHAFRATIIKTRSMVAFGDSSPAVQHIYLPIVQRVSYSSTISARRSSNSPDQAAPVNNESEETASSSDTWQNHRSRWARRKHRKKMDKLRQHVNDQDDTLVDNENGLNWDKFEFGDSPKMDRRFSSDNLSSEQVGIPEEILNTIPANSLTYKSYVESEASLDEATSQNFKDSQSDLLSLSPQLVQQCIDILSPYVQDRRMERIDEVLSQRTRHTRFLFENPSNPSNVWACLRTLDSFGIQYVDVIINSQSYSGKAAVGQKKGMRTAMGSACWMTLRQFGSTEEAIRVLREEEGCLIYASDLNPASMDVRNLNWDVDIEQVSSNDDYIQRPICVVMGNEDRGISAKMRELADETFYLPMCGFAESFNLSVATAITLAHMSAVSNDVQAGSTVSNNKSKGPLRPGDLDPHELQCLRLKGVLNSLAQKRMGKALLKKEGITLPNSLYN